MNVRRGLAAVVAAGVAGLLLLMVVCGCSTTNASKDGRELPIAELLEAANNGDAVAQHNLGCRYHEGNGVAKDMVEAVKWLRKAAEQGLPRAQGALGVCYRDGDGVEKDLEECAFWYELVPQGGGAGTYVCAMRSWQLVRQRHRGCKGHVRGGEMVSEIGGTG